MSTPQRDTQTVMLGSKAIAIALRIKPQLNQPAGYLATTND
jgi:hypothetical protein